MNNPNFGIEIALWEKKIPLVAGVDEVGRGPLAGPIVAAAVIFPAFFKPIFPSKTPNIRDSKKLSHTQRQLLSMYIKQESLCYSTAFIDNKEIDKLGIQQANTSVYYCAIDKLSPKPQVVLCDYLKPSYPHPFFNADKIQFIKKGDSISVSIAAASILAKVERDNYMETEAHIQFPQYGFNKHKGYGTKEHVEAIVKFGPCPLHRTTFLKRLYAQSKT